MYVDEQGESVAGKGSLFRLDGRKLTRIFPNTNISNGIAWTKDNKTMYFNDSGDRVIYQFDYDLDTGEISNNRILVDLREKDFEGAESGSIGKT